MTIASVEQVIDERRLAAADVDDPRGPIVCRILYQAKRNGQMRLVPADLGWPLGAIDPLPMPSDVHGTIVAPGPLDIRQCRFETARHPGQQAG